MSCPLDPDTVIAPGFPLSPFLKSLEKQASCGEPTYLRPDRSGSMLPWLYCLVWLVVHIPLVIIRVVKWEKVQALSIVLATVNFGSTIIAYVSTRRRGEEVLVWMPLTIMLDAGAMILLFWLIIDEIGLRGLQDAIPMRIKTAANGQQVSYQLVNGPLVNGQHVPDQQVNGQQVSGQHVPDQHVPNQQVNGQQISGQQVPDKQVPRGKAIVALLAFIVFIGLVILQIIGLAAANDALKNTQDMKATFCSTIFQGAVAVQDGNCQFRPVTTSASKGIGCIDLPATQQINWLKATVGVVSVSIAFQVIDMVVLYKVKSDDKWRGVKMRRPWLTMFGGILVLVMLCVVAGINASTLPRYMTDTVWVYKYEPSTDTSVVCRGTLTSAGLRGSIIGWTDGFLNSLGSAYYGQ